MENKLETSNTEGTVMGSTGAQVVSLARQVLVGMEGVDRPRGF